MSLKLCAGLLLFLIAPTIPLSANQSDALVVQSFYDNVCAFQRDGDWAALYSFNMKYLANSFITTGINGKSHGKPSALPNLQNAHSSGGSKPTSCFTEVRNVTRNGNQITAEVTLQGLRADSSSSVYIYVARYGVVFVNSPPWQLLKSTELEHWWLDANGTVLAHALLPGTASQTPPPDRMWYVFPLAVGTQMGHLTLLIPPDVNQRQRSVRHSFSEFGFYDGLSASPLFNLAEGDSSYDLKNFTKTCLNGRLAWSIDGSDSGDVVMGVPGSWVSLWWSGLSGDRLAEARAIVSSMNLDFGPTC
jgi:hypothetical protein